MEEVFQASSHQVKPSYATSMCLTHFYGHYYVGAAAKAARRQKLQEPPGITVDSQLTRNPSQNSPSLMQRLSVGQSLIPGSHFLQRQLHRP